MRHFHTRLPVMLGLLIALMVGIAAPGVSVRAQDADSPDLTEEQLEWLARVHDAVMNLDTMTNYTVTHTGTSFTELTLQLGGDSLTGSLSESWLRTQTVFPGDPINVAAAITATSSTVDFGAAEAASYGLLADARLVDGVLYVNATPIQSEPDVPDVPAGWIIVDDPDDDAYDVLSSLQLDDLLDDDTIFDDLDALTSAVVDVTWEPVKLAGGPLVAQITVTFSLDVIFLESYGLSEADQVRWHAILDSAAQVDATIRAVMFVNADMLPVMYRSELIWRIENTDAATMFPNGSLPAGTIVDVYAETAQESTITGVNEPADPVTAPE